MGEQAGAGRRTPRQAGRRQGLQLLPSRLSLSAPESHRVVPLRARGLYRRWGLAPRPEVVAGGRYRRPGAGVNWSASAEPRIADRGRVNAGCGRSSRGTARASALLEHRAKAPRMDSARRPREAGPLRQRDCRGETRLADVALRLADHERPARAQRPVELRQERAGVGKLVDDVDGQREIRFSRPRRRSGGRSRRRPPSRPCRGRPLSAPAAAAPPAFSAAGPRRRRVPTARRGEPGER